VRKQHDWIWRPVAIVTCVHGTSGAVHGQFKIGFASVAEKNLHTPRWRQWPVTQQPDVGLQRIWVLAQTFCQMGRTGLFLVDSPQWQSPPFSPTLRDIGGRTIDWQSQTHYDGESRIFARSAGDDKAAIAATISALDALRSLNAPLSVNVKLLFDGEG
jgi:hypothetical protein